MTYCLSCKRFDISLFGFLCRPGSDDNPRLEAPIYTVGTLQEINQRQNSCHLCQLVSVNFRSWQLRSSAEYTDPRRIRISGAWINGLGPSEEQRLKGTALCILIYGEIAGSTLSSPWIPIPFKVVVRAVSSMFPNQPHFGRLILDGVPLLDFSMIEKWLRHCESKHEACSHSGQPSEPPTKNFLVIDVISDCIVVAPERCRYLALSYVWGNVDQIRLRQENFGNFTLNGSLSKTRLTQTIRDAMTLARGLGQRYLWVDALCILQDVEVVRQQAIDDMDRIYAQSLLTIVVGTCESANDPLPGVIMHRSHTNRIHKVSPSLTLSAHFDFADYLENTKYNERAWTFQEYQLANRLLIFTPDGQVHFSCKEAVYSEDVVAGTEFEPDAALLDGADRIKLRQDPKRLWSIYQQGVLNFTARSMTVEKDILNAFTGILKMICSERSLEGLPIPIFDLALLWQPKEQLRRRQGFSSWSWAGWVGKVQWFDDHSLSSEKMDQTETEKVASWTASRTWIVWYSSWGTNVRSPAYIMDGPPWVCGKVPSAEQHRLRFSSLKHKFAPRPDNLKSSLDKLEPQRRRIRYLQFWTASAYFEIEHRKRNAHNNQSVELTTSDNGLQMFLLRDRHGVVCGWVLLGDEWASRTSRSDIRRQEFIMLSEGRCSTSYPQPPEYKPGGTEGSDTFGEFNAMMIVTTGSISERAGLGRVRKDALSYSCWRDAKWKEIVLG